MTMLSIKLYANVEFNECHRSNTNMNTFNISCLRFGDMHDDKTCTVLINDSRILTCQVICK